MSGLDEQIAAMQAARAGGLSGAEAAAADKVAFGKSGGFDEDVYGGHTRGGDAYATEVMDFDEDAATGGGGGGSGGGGGGGGGSSSHPASRSSINATREQMSLGGGGGADDDDAALMNRYREAGGSGLLNTRISDREDSYRQRRMNRGLSPSRAAAGGGGGGEDAAGGGGGEQRSYKEIMAEQMLVNETAEVMQKIAKKQEAAAQEAKVAEQQGGGARKRRRWDDAGGAAGQIGCTIALLPPRQPAKRQPSPPAAAAAAVAVATPTAWASEWACAWAWDLRSVSRTWAAWWISSPGSHRSWSCAAPRSPCSGRRPQQRVMQQQQQQEEEEEEEEEEEAAAVEDDDDEEDEDEGWMLTAAPADASAEQAAVEAEPHADHECPNCKRKFPSKAALAPHIARWCKKTPAQQQRRKAGMDAGRRSHTRTVTNVTWTPGWHCEGENDGDALVGRRVAAWWPEHIQ